MLKSLYISNYALIEHLEIEFPQGLIIITGETGAGKSILLGAISLLLGAKAEKELLKDENKNCVVEALFSITKEGGEEEYLIRRVLYPNGRTRSFVNDEPVTNQYLKELSEQLIDIHAQHEHLLIGDSNFRLSVLDSFAKNYNLYQEYLTNYSTLKEVGKTLKEYQNLLIAQERDYEYNKFQYENLKEANLVEGEVEELEREQLILSNADQIKSSLAQISMLFNIQERSLVQTLKEIATLYAKITSIESASNLAERVESCRIELREIESENEQLANNINYDPARLQFVEERLSSIYTLFKKHGVDDTQGLLSLIEEYGSKLSLNTSYKEKIEELEILYKEREEKMVRSAKKLTESRIEAASKFSKLIESKVRELEMPYARFSTKIKELNDYTTEGRERVEFYFSANKEIDEREISKIASGGELSRIMLCLKSILATGGHMPTLIFDEIDSGVSGSIAEKMGNLIDELSKNVQLFAITHLPQIASKGGCHLLVYKEEDKDGVATTKIKKIEKEDRVVEIARMLSGSTLTEAAISNAKEFLKVNPYY